MQQSLIAAFLETSVGCRKMAVGKKKMVRDGDRVRVERAGRVKGCIC